MSDAKSIAQRCIVEMRAAKKAGKLDWDLAEKIIIEAIELDELLAEDQKPKRKSAPKGSKIVRPRNEVLDALMHACGMEIEKVTRSAARAAAVALAEIKQITPDVSVIELHSAAVSYKSRHRDWTISPSALAKNWHEFAPKRGVPKPQEGSPYIEPINWREKARAMWGNSIELPSTWLDLSYALRADLVKRYLDVG